MPMGGTGEEDEDDEEGMADDEGGGGGGEEMADMSGGARRALDFGNTGSNGPTSDNNNTGAGVGAATGTGSTGGTVGSMMAANAANAGNAYRVQVFGRDDADAGLYCARDEEGHGGDSIICNGIAETFGQDMWNVRKLDITPLIDGKTVPGAVAVVLESCKGTLLSHENGKDIVMLDDDDDVLGGAVTSPVHSSTWVVRRADVDTKIRGVSVIRGRTFCIQTPQGACLRHIRSGGANGGLVLSSSYGR